MDGFEYIEDLRRQNGSPVQHFRAFSRYLEVKAREKGVPVSGQFELTPLCNFSCRMCYVHLDASQLSGRKVLSADTWKDLMCQTWEAGMLHASLTGGECLTYQGFDELFLYLQSLGCTISVLTNGYLLDDRRIAFFRQHRPAAIQITLYGCSNDVYERVTGQPAFDTVIGNIRKAMDAGLNVDLTVTPNRYLGEDVLETVRLGRRLDHGLTVNTSLFAPREETGRSRQEDSMDADQYVRLYRLMNELAGRKTKEIDPDRLPPAGGPSHECTQCGLQCGGGRSAFVIDWKGTMMPCNRLNVIHADPVREGFKEAWARINREAESWPRVPECEGCAYRSVCNICAASMLRYAEPGRQPTELCETVRYYIRHGVVNLPECE
ncbi:MAG: radical SAM protein [Clostridia bacterium]|nr:radical SAM protein [Clostridia bacterium]